MTRSMGLNFNMTCNLVNNISFSVLILYYIRLYHWRKLNEGYKGLSELIFFFNFLQIDNYFKIKC